MFKPKQQRNEIKNEGVDIPSLVELFDSFNNTIERIPSHENIPVIVYGKVLESAIDDSKQNLELIDLRKRVKLAVGSTALGISMLWGGSQADNPSARFVTGAGFMTAAFSGMYAVFGAKRSSRSVE